MVRTELWKRDSSNSTATFTSLRSSWRSNRGSANEMDNELTNGVGNMASAAAFARGRRNGALKTKQSQQSIRSVVSTASSSAESYKAGKKSRPSLEQRPSPQPRNSFSFAVDRAREVTRTRRVDSNSSKYSNASSTKSKRRSAHTVMQSGRHGNEWLFGGWSLRETVKGLMK